MNPLFAFGFYVNVLVCPLDAYPIPAFDYVRQLPHGTNSLITAVIPSSVKCGLDEQDQYNCVRETRDCMYTTREKEL